MSRVHDSQQIDGHSVAEQESQGYRDFIATILQFAHDDCATGREECALDAYDWVLDKDPVFRLYCGLLGYDADDFRDKFITKHRDRCERLRRNVAERDERRMEIEDEKAAAVGRKAVRAAERDRKIRYNKLWVATKPENRPEYVSLTDDEKQAIYTKAVSDEYTRLWKIKAETEAAWARMERR